MRVLTVVCAPQQFIKSVTVSKALYRSSHHEILVHAVLWGFIEIGEPVVLPAPARTKRRIAVMGASLGSEIAVSNIRLVDPVGYLGMLMLQKNPE